ncbi:sugar phosphate isomerase/epimerase family protein [Cohnella lupini]|uniref:Sugar phosphate isomerase/epimerase n=1 Tax=Cohnella lupini TaxID=1294267 RepID=A0A3D9HTB6_9BACL|nr:sugar phosphate isomerase/epimerase family protein [Cohnella lupini]RED52753.1 sugar phosphate isomerase/epimerase [Cohnella lupini]
MKISTSIHMFEMDYPIAQAIQRCKSAGFEALDFNYTDYVPRLLSQSWVEEERWAREIREAADRHHIAFTQMHGPFNGPAFDTMYSSRHIEAFLALAERSLRTASILGVPWVVFHPNQISLQSGETYAKQREFNREVYAKLLPAMEETGVGIALENMFDRPRGGGKLRSYCAMPEELAELVGGLNHPLFGACWDTGHGNVQGLNQGESIRALGSLLKATHIQDNSGLSDDHLLPFLGNINWKEVMGGLNDVGYTGDLTYEIHRFFRPIPTDLLDSAMLHAVNTSRHLLSAIGIEAACQ